MVLASANKTGSLLRVAARPSALLNVAAATDWKFGHVVVAREVDDGEHH
jgi:hypothetical protein